MVATFLVYALCVCIVFSSHLFWRQSLRSVRHVQTLCSVSRGVHLFRVLFCLTKTNRGTQEGAFFFSLFFFFASPSSCGACLHFYREKGSAVPIPRQQLSRFLSTHTGYFGSKKLYLKKVAVLGPFKPAAFSEESRKDSDFWEFFFRYVRNRSTPIFQRTKCFRTFFAFSEISFVGAAWSSCVHC